MSRQMIPSKIQGPVLEAVGLVTTARATLVNLLPNNAPLGAIARRMTDIEAELRVIAAQIGNPPVNDNL